MNCPICERKKPANLHFTCAECWVKIPTKDRLALAEMLHRNQPTASRLEAVVRKLRPPPGR